MNYNLLLDIWLWSCVPFILSNFIVMYRLCFHNKLVCGVYDDQKLGDLSYRIKDLKMKMLLFPKTFANILVFQVIFVLSIIDGLIWLYKPYRQLLKLYNVVIFNFKEIK